MTAAASPNALRSSANTSSRPSAEKPQIRTDGGAMSQSLRPQMKHFVVLRDQRPADIAMTEPLSLSLGQQFELERMNRAIDSTADLQTLQGLAKQLLQAWHSQKAATQWVMRQQLNGPSQLSPELSPALAQQWGLEA
jgi:hypothetical protein